MAAKGLTEVLIANELERIGLGRVSQPGISKMLSRVERRVLKQMDGKVRRKKARQDAALMHVYRDAMAAWEKSKEPQRTVTTKEDSGGNVKETLTVVRETPGDPRYLDQARQALADIRKIWGVDEPAQTKSDVSGRLGLEIVEVIVDAEGPPDGSAASGATGAM